MKVYPEANYPLYSLVVEIALWKEKQMEKWVPKIPKEKKKGMHRLLLVESYLVVDSTKSWWIDFRASNDIYNSLLGFQLRKRLNDGEMNLDLAFQARIVV